MTWLATGIDSVIMNCDVCHMLREAGLKIGDKVDCFYSIILTPSSQETRYPPLSTWKMIFGPSSHRIASIKSRYIKATCRNKRCSEFTGSSIGVVGGIKHLVTTSSALSYSHSSVGWWSTSPLVLMVSDEAIAALRCALKACRRNSSPVLKTLTPLSTEVRRAISRRLHNDPGWFGAPQKIVNTTQRHSQRKWKSPIKIRYPVLIIVQTSTVIFVYLGPHLPIEICPCFQPLFASTACYF